MLGMLITPVFCLQWDHLLCPHQRAAVMLHTCPFSGVIWHSVITHLSPYLAVTSTALIHKPHHSSTASMLLPAYQAWHWMQHINHKLLVNGFIYLPTSMWTNCALKGPICVNESVPFLYGPYFSCHEVTWLQLSYLIRIRLLLTLEVLFLLEG